MDPRSSGSEFDPLESGASESDREAGTTPEATLIAPAASGHESPKAPSNVEAGTAHLLLLQKGQWRRQPDGAGMLSRVWSRSTRMESEWSLNHSRSRSVPCLGVLCHSSVQTTALGMSV